MEVNTDEVGDQIVSEPMEMDKTDQQNQGNEDLGNKEEKSVNEIKELHDGGEMLDPVDKTESKESVKQEDQKLNVQNGLQTSKGDEIADMRNENIESIKKNGLVKIGQPSLVEADLEERNGTGSEEDMEEAKDLFPDSLEVKVPSRVGSFVSKKAVTIPVVTKTDEGDDLGIYDDPGESGEDLSDTELETKVNIINVPEPTNYEDKTPPTPILRNSGLPQHSDYTRGPKVSRNSGLLHWDSEGPDDFGGHVTWSAHNKQYEMSASDLRHMSGIRGKANTPASHITDFSMDSRNTSRVPSESREAMFRRAMSLLSARCTSVAPGIETPFGMAKSSSFGAQVPKYFYIRQERPSPMPPLKAWQGYHGNVYFEPIQISSVRDPPQKQEHPFDKTNELHRMLMTQQKQNDRPESNNTGTLSRNATKTPGSTKDGTRPSTRQMVLLDKRVVLTRQNNNVQTDLDLIENYESTGSLTVRPKSDITSDRPKMRKSENITKKDRICKGSVVRHKLNQANRSFHQPEFKVSGGKYSTTVSTAPLLRTQTQYSLSNQRLTTNSPDLANQQLPPLEQLRATVRHMDSANKDKNNSYGQVQRPASYSDNLKPFIKYSPEIKAKKQTGFV